MGMKWEGKGFMESLPKIYAIYTGGFLAFFALMAFFETLGMSAKWIGILFVLFTLVVYAFIGVLSRTTAVDAYYVAGRSVPPVFNGMATAADWMSGASFVAMAGGIFMSGHPADGAVPAQVRLLYGAGLHRHALRRQADALLRGRGAGGRVVHLRDGPDHRHRHDRRARIPDSV